MTTKVSGHNVTKIEPFGRMSARKPAPSPKLTQVNVTEPVFEVTQILASRFDCDDDQWLLVQWGCTWIPRSSLEDGPLLQAYLVKPMLSQSGTRVHIPIEEGQQTSLDAAAFYRRKAARKLDAERDGSNDSSSDKSSVHQRQEGTPRKSLGLEAKRKS